jgi:hypothetical protein
LPRTVDDSTAGDGERRARATDLDDDVELDPNVDVDGDVRRRHHRRPRR